MNAAGLIASLQMRLSRLSLFRRIVIGNAIIIVFGAVIGTLITRHLAQQAADINGGLPLIVPGIELSAEDETGDVHMLGYFFDILPFTIGNFERGENVAG